MTLAREQRERGNMSIKRENIMRRRKARPHHSPAKRDRHNTKIELQREALREEAA